MKAYALLFSLFLSLIFMGCKSQKLSLIETPANYEESIKEWQRQRKVGLSRANGWLSLVGLHWLKEGENTVGSAADNDIQLVYNAPAHIGTYTLKDGQVSCQLNEIEGLERQEANSCDLRYQSLQWRMIERGGQHGIRIRDTLLPSRIRLRPIDYFPIDPAYRVAAKWTAANTQDSVLMRNVLDMEFPVHIAGSLRFELGGKTHQLTALDGGKNDLFLIFSDDTTGESTYGGGRYLYCPKADASGITIIDFNKTYNPPCAFTKYATCLLPRAENHIELMLEAGEKAFGDH